VAGGPEHRHLRTNVRSAWRGVVRRVRAPRRDRRPDHRRPAHRGEPGNSIFYVLGALAVLGALLALCVPTSTRTAQRERAAFDADAAKRLVSAAEGSSDRDRWDRIHRPSGRLSGRAGRRWA